jgi:starch synthase
VSTPRYRGVQPERTPSVPGRRFHFVEHDGYFDRAGLYGEDGVDYPDNDRRFAYFARASLDAAATQGFAPDVVHLHDWQAALAAFLVRSEGALPGSSVVYTVHNLAYQGVFPPATLTRVGLPGSAFTFRGLEFHGDVSYMKAGLVFADAVTTVSPRYAREIQTPAFGFGLEGVLRDRAAAGELYGILNGADYTDWSPEVDPNLPEPYTARRLSPKRLAKSALQRDLGLEVRRDAPLLGMVTRLDRQKGVDLVIELATDLVELGVQLAILGNGDPALERRLTRLAGRHAGWVGVRIGFVDSLAHLIQGGSDILLMPSRWEPCGLNQMYAMRYGTVPVVSAVGGLDDTIEEGRTGFKFEPDDPGGLLAAIQRAVARYRGDATAWKRMMRAGMAMDFSWTVSAREYLHLFATVTGSPAAP